MVWNTVSPSTMTETWAEDSASCAEMDTSSGRSAERHGMGIWVLMERGMLVLFSCALLGSDTVAAYGETFWAKVRVEWGWGKDNELTSCIGKLYKPFIKPFSADIPNFISIFCVE